MGPSSDTAASSDAAADWNPFRSSTNPSHYTRSLQKLDNYLKETFSMSLDQCFLVDAFPLLYWPQGCKPTASQYKTHRQLGIDFLKYAVKALRPNLILSFGSVSSWVLHYALDDAVKPEDSQMHPTAANHHHPLGLQTINDQRVLFLKHPSAHGTNGELFGPLENVRSTLKPE
eukprot:m.920380 g.920380  ORF g.920380 m.920380 type:complete len:173 (+) comp64086_c0_seq1:230-748(+)